MSGQVALHVELLEQSFDLVAPRGEELVDRFYRHVLERAPAVAPLFAQTDLGTQKKMLLATLVLLRKSLRQLEALVPALEALGARHVAYGVRPEHYPLVGTALLQSRAEIGAAGWRDEYTAAWAAAYSVVQETMLRGAQSVRPRRTEARVA